MENVKLEWHLMNNMPSEFRWLTNDEYQFWYQYKYVNCEYYKWMVKIKAKKIPKTEENSTGFQVMRWALSVEHKQIQQTKKMHI